MSAKLLYGKPCVDSICERVRKETNGLNAKLCTIGFNEARWNQYALSLAKSAEKYGFLCENVTVPDDIEPRAFFETVESICLRNDIGGVIIQQPLPVQYKAAVNFVCVDKDVDCLNPLSVCKLYNGEDGYRPATPLAVLRLLDFYNIDLRSKNVVVVGRGNAVGKPLALMLLERDATVTVCHTKTKNLALICRNADILISACGVAGLITADFVTDKSIVIDVGLSFVDGKTRGDVSEEVYDLCAAVSPVPGGVGPVTRATLFENLLTASKENR